MTYIEKEIFEISKNSEWISLRPNGFVKYYINPINVHVVKKWRISDRLKIAIMKNNSEYPIKIKNATASNFVYAKFK
tara:strand:- start:87656 stop:87886 length:231 start_codon:yes stop_codon:yes gene_type:complete